MAHLVNKTQLEQAIDKLEGLNDFHKQHIKDRWLTYVVWWDDRAATNKWKHFTLRSIVVVGSVVLPALIGTAALPVLSSINETQVNTIQWIAFSLSLLVGIAAALEGLFRFGEIWRDKRAAGEILKCEGWRYFQLIGKYKGKTHIDVYSDFAATVEDMIEHEIKDYLLVTRPKEEEQNTPGKH